MVGLWAPRSADAPTIDAPRNMPTQWVQGNAGDETGGLVQTDDCNGCQGAYNDVLW